jgi:hypothetical protein
MLAGVAVALLILPFVGSFPLDQPIKGRKLNHFRGRSLDTNNVPGQDSIKKKSDGLATYDENRQRSNEVYSIANSPRDPAFVAPKLPKVAPKPEPKPVGPGAPKGPGAPPAAPKTGDPPPGAPKSPGTGDPAPGHPCERGLEGRCSGNESDRPPSGDGGDVSFSDASSGDDIVPSEDRSNKIVEYRASGEKKVTAMNAKTRDDPDKPQAMSMDVSYSVEQLQNDIPPTHDEFESVDRIFHDLGLDAETRFQGGKIQSWDGVPGKSNKSPVGLNFISTAGKVRVIRYSASTIDILED